MKMVLKGVQDGKPFTVTAGVPDVIAWEYKFNKSASEWAGGNVGMKDLAFLAWNALKRSGETNLNHDQWLNKLDEISGEADDPKATEKEA